MTKDIVGQSVVDLLGGHHGDTAVVVLLVVPVEELLAERTGILCRSEPVRELRAVLERFELRFRVRVVVADIGAAVGLGDSKIRKKESHRFGSHARPAVGMHSQLAGLNVLFDEAFFDQSLGQGGKFPKGHHPADDVSAEDVQNDVKVEVGPLSRTFQLCNVPGPDLVRGGRQQLRLAVVRSLDLPASFFDTAVLCFENAVHRSNRAQVAAFVEHGGMDLGNGQILKPRAVKDFEDLALFCAA